MLNPATRPPQALKAPRTKHLDSSLERCRKHIMQHTAGTRGAHSANGRAGAPHTHRDVRSSQDSATRMATRERSRKVTESYRHARRDSTPQVILRPQTRVQTCYCSRSYTHKVRLRRPWNGDWRSFFVLKSVDSLPLEARWSWQLPTGAESPLPTVTAGWLRCPPAEPQSRGLSDYSPIHTPIFSSPPLLLCSPMHTVERPTPFWVRPILCFCGATQNFMQ